MIGTHRILVTASRVFCLLGIFALAFYGQIVMYNRLVVLEFRQTTTVQETGSAHSQASIRQTQ